MASLELRRVLSAFPRELERDLRHAGSSDALGRFEFRDLAEGTYELVAQAPSFQPETRVVLLAGEPHPELELELAPHGFLEGGVVDAKGVRVVGATVRVSEGAGGDVTDANGVFSLELPAGVYRLTAALGSQMGVADEPQVVEVGGTTRCPIIQLGRPGRMEVRVVEAESGTPLQGVRVRIQPAASLSVTNAEGRFSVEDLLPGEYRLSATAEGFTDEAIRVAVSAGQTARPVLALRRMGVLEGRLLTVEGVGATGVSIEVGWLGADEPIIIQPDSAGRFSTGRIPAGTIKVSTRSATGVILSSDVFSIEPGKVTRRDLSLRSTGRVSGTVRDADGAWPGSAMVGLTSSQGGNAVLAQVPVDEQGAFSLEVTEGAYLLRAYPSGQYGAFGPSVEAAVRSGSESTVALMLPHQVRALAGVVVGPGGAPAAGAAILVRGSAFEARRVADPFGRFSLYVPGDGEFEVRALREGRSAVILSRPDTGLTLRLTEGARVRGTVRGDWRTDEPLQVTIRSEHFEELRSDGMDGMQFRGDQFEWVDVPAGRLRIVVTASSGAQGTATVVVAPGQTASVSIELARLTGRAP
ncbi:carboxypeptidase regulatory-like domain-containing protein [Myxococcus qinghaiensis]|uniref:carboxypeptidase regulatory-like domain-containing protein n=1 Tax=Myxococcus qinghaiensis TaxID=2906758 RepID=UPI0020A704EB|nr:carboxypeptidase regulatory-like domain-containing protein [Myxococcus qinghaiensis]MCP3163827.1 carboxypeptidase regulatory-like domain-containing protein [Myxococcus qinghaiensis]